MAAKDTHRHIQKPGHVFVNCPFDGEYQGLFDAIVFAVFDCGFTARCAKEIIDSGVIRIQTIERIIEECKFGIHDISRVELNPSGLPRFNMPFELGLFLGARRYGTGVQKEKGCLVLDSQKYRYLEFISDISGQDIKAHGNDKKKCISVIRDWLNDASGRKTLPGGKAIYKRFTKFEEDLPYLCRKLEAEPSELTFNDFATMVSEWLKAYEA